MKNWTDYPSIPRRRSFIEDINIPEEILINRPTWVVDEEFKRTSF